MRIEAIPAHLLMVNLRGRTYAEWRAERTTFAPLQF
jgi:hypothetical protein